MGMHCLYQRLNYQMKPNLPPAILCNYSHGMMSPMIKQTLCVKRNLSCLLPWGASLLCCCIPAPTYPTPQLTWAAAAPVAARLLLCVVWLLWWLLLVATSWPVSPAATSTTRSSAIASGCRWWAAKPAWWAPAHVVAASIPATTATAAIRRCAAKLLPSWSPHVAACHHGVGCGHATCSWAPHGPVCCILCASLLRRCEDRLACIQLVNEVQQLPGLCAVVQLPHLGHRHLHAAHTGVQHRQMGKGREPAHTHMAWQGAASLHVGKFQADSKIRSLLHRLRYVDEKNSTVLAERARDQGGSGGEQKETGHTPYHDDGRCTRVQGCMHAPPVPVAHAAWLYTRAFVFPSD